MHSDVTAEMLDRAELYGQCQFLPNEAMQLLDVVDLAGELEERYKKGVLSAQVAVRRAMLQKAQDGDGSAQKEFLKLALVVTAS